MTEDQMTVELLRVMHQEVFGEQHVPLHWLETLDRYEDEGLEPGGCCLAVLRGDLYDAFQRADLQTARAMPAIVGYVFNELDGRCWGSREAVERWIAHGGLKGIDAQAQAPEAKAPAGGGGVADGAGDGTQDDALASVPGLGVADARHRK